MKKMLLLAAVTALAACGGRNNPDQTSSEGAVLPNAGGRDTTAVTTDTTTMNRDTSAYGRDTTTVNANPSVSSQDTTMVPGGVTNDSLRILCGRFAQGDTSAVLSDTTWTTERLRMRCQDMNSQPGMQRDSMMHHDSAGMQMNDSTPSSADSTRPPPRF